MKWQNRFGIGEERCLQKGKNLFASVMSAAISGMEVCPVNVEADVSDGLPCFTMVGFPSTQVKEAQDRVRTALRNNGISLPPKRVTVNLAPADLRKEGAGFDLPVAAAVLGASGFLEPKQLNGAMLMGEISLSGEVRSVSGVLPRVILGQGAGVQILYGPFWKSGGSQACAGHEGDRGEKYNGNGELSCRSGQLQTGTDRRRREDTGRTDPGRFHGDLRTGKRQAGSRDCSQRISQYPVYRASWNRQNHAGKKNSNDHALPYL